MKCHYEILEVPRNASDDEIKKVYRKLALKWHPDKNLDNLEEAKEQFQLVQQAYEVLSDPHERAWYDNHREAILKGGIGDDYKDDSIDLFQYFSSSCFKGYGDDSKGFYTVYRGVFEKLVAEDAEFSKEEDSDEEVPGFGDSTSSYEDVHKFYSYWQSYSTKKSFAWLDPWNIREAPNRYALRQMEKENKKVRDKAKKERNEQVRNLVAFVRKRDKRVQAHAKRLEEKAKENKRKMEERKKQQLLERQKELKDHKESDWSKFSNIQSELKNIEASYAAEFGEELTSDDEKELDLEDSNALYCVACTKIFKTQKAFSNHENSKKHKDNVAAMKASLVQDDADFPSSGNESEDDDSGSIDQKDSLQPGTKLATGPGMPDFLLNPPAQSKDDVCDDQKTSDGEKNSDSDSVSKSEIKNKSKKSTTSIESSLGQGFILGKSDDRSREEGYTSDTPDEELLSDQEEQIVPKAKKQKKKKNKPVQRLLLDDSDDDEEKEINLLSGLSKKQRKKQQQQKILLNKLSTNSPRQSLNTDSINTEKHIENLTSVNLEGNQGNKAEESDDDSPQETVSPLPGKKKGKKAKELRKAQRAAAGEARESNAKKITKSAVNVDVDNTCAVCKQEFPSKNKLFEHLTKTGHSVPTAAKIKKSNERTGKGKLKSKKDSD